MNTFERYGLTLLVSREMKLYLGEEFNTNVDAVTCGFKPNGMINCQNTNFGWYPDEDYPLLGAYGISSCAQYIIFQFWNNEESESKYYSLDKTAIFLSPNVLTEVEEIELDESCVTN